MGLDGHLSEELRKTDRDEDFILFEDEKLIIFTTKSNLPILKQQKHWFADGTFKVIYQLSNILLPFFVSQLGMPGWLLSIMHITCYDE